MSVVGTEAMNSPKPTKPKYVCMIKTTFPLSRKRDYFCVSLFPYDFGDGNVSGMEKCAAWFQSEST